MTCGCLYSPHLAPPPIFRRSGVDLAISTLCNWGAICVDELEPIVAELRRTIVAGRIVQADETPIVVLENHNRKERRQGWLWVYRSMRGETAFDCRPTRARDGAEFPGYIDYAGICGG